ncbi:MAG: hypothetical protein FJZ92_06470 [Chloroflexi bacterium]|nr:hypothetical protein [Chloroflexota bacterium]
MYVRPAPYHDGLELDDVKAQIRAVTPQARLAATVEGEPALQKKRRDMEAQQRRQRQRIFDVEDEIREPRSGRS